MTLADHRVGWNEVPAVRRDADPVAADRCTPAVDVQPPRLECNATPVAIWLEILEL